MKILKDLHHERIVTYYGTDRTDSELHIFMEYMPGVRLVYSAYLYNIYILYMNIVCGESKFANAECVFFAS